MVTKSETVHMLPSKQPKQAGLASARTLHVPQTLTNALKVSEEETMSIADHVPSPISTAYDADLDGSATFFEVRTCWAQTLDPGV